MALYLGEFNVQAEQNHVQIRFTTKAGFTCEDIIIRHGTDSSQLSPIYTYLGICGSTSEEVTYTYLFNSVVFNVPNYFQIDLGQFGKSDLKQISIVKRNGLQPIVFPNPIQANSLLLFSNVGRELATVTVYTTQGTSIAQTIKTYGESIPISDFQLIVPGIYFYTILIKGITRQGKFLIL